MKALCRWAVGPLSACLGLAGCVSPLPNLKPNHPEEFRLPPTEDRRFRDPTVYPHVREELRKTEDVAPNGKQMQQGMAGRVPGR